jgi:2-polyprenyl-3-methyl-5-hydroxy-6-metoxy-1,4-benzoquinol methylase
LGDAHPKDSDCLPQPFFLFYTFPSKGKLLSGLTGRNSMAGSKQEQYQERYKAEMTPWDTGRPDFNLVDLVTNRPIEKGKALDVGCGSGHNSIWLAQHEFLVTGVDVSEIALEKAKENASKEKVKMYFSITRFFRERRSGSSL